MDTAICIEDGHIFTAVEFAGLAPAVLERKRRLLVCEECAAPAFFRRRSRSGRGACFGARPHDEGCNQAATDNEQIVPGVANDEAEVINLGDRIIVDIAYGAQNQEVHLDANPLGPRRARGGRHVAGGGPRHADMHRRLSTLLRTLITAPNFRYSDQMIAVAGRPEMPARDFFVELIHVTDRYDFQFRGYWGMVSDARRGADDVLWLNSGGRANMSICLPPEVAAAVMQRYNFTDEDDFSGAYVLVLGTARVSQYGKVFCAIDDAALLSLR
jgi:hypothetical protein